MLTLSLRWCCIVPALANALFLEAFKNSDLQIYRHTHKPTTICLWSMSTEVQLHEMSIPGQHNLHLLLLSSNNTQRRLAAEEVLAE